MAEANRVTYHQDLTLRGRLAAKVDLSADRDACWVWRGALAGGGYGQIWAANKVRYAHRVVYELLVGPIPDGLQLDHLCRNTACVNPAHLEPVTMAENVRRGWATGEHVRWNTKKAHCPRGHPYSGTNSQGRRICRTCINARRRVR